jgi:RhtB (resistance to homoserine/threonine) family protein
MVGDFAAFLGISVVVVVTPGQDTALTIRNALRGGRRSGVFTALGIATGQATWTVATSAGLAALLLASQPVFAALKFAGAAYLVFLGAQMVRGALRPDRSAHPAIDECSARPLAASVAFRQGVISNLSNPKMAVFFVSLLPQFTPHGQASFIVLLLLGLVFCSLTLAWLTGYAIAVAKAGDFLRRPRIRRTLDGLFGAVLVAFGLRLATEHR